VAAHQEQDAAK
jgi:hypothetical protein